MAPNPYTSVAGPISTTGRVRGGLRPAAEVLAEAAALDELHGEVAAAGVFADVVDLHDIRMPHARGSLCLDAEAAALLSAGQGAVADQLECHQSRHAHLA